MLFVKCFYKVFLCSDVYEVFLYSVVCEVFL